MQGMKVNTRLWVTVLVTVVTVALAASSTQARTGNYLIITASAYYDSAPLNQLVAAKTAQGLTVMVQSVPSGTTRTAIKTYIEGLWGTEDAPDYILLVGDTDGDPSTTTTIPHWTGGGSKHAATDWPYACMDGGDDWHPEIPIGRFSVRSVGTLQAVVDKTLRVESGNYPDPDYVKRGAFLANPSTYNTAEPTHDWVIENYFDPIGYEGIKIYAAQGGDTQDVTNAVNNGCLWAVYYGHSSSSGWWDPSFNQSNINALSNDGLYGLVFAFACNTAHYTYDECFGETWLRAANKGAAAYISASDYIYWGSAEAWLPSVILEKSFFRAIFEDGIWEVGPAWMQGLYHFEADFGGSTDIERNFFEEFVLLGDPSLLLPQPGGGSDLHVAPLSGLAAEGPNGGPFTPDSITYTLTNNAEVPISFTVSTDELWIDIDNPGGVIPVEGTAQVVVSINSLADVLANGHYEALIDFVNNTTHDGDTTRLVTLDVGVPTPMISFPMDSNPGWSTQGLWAFGQPTGQGGQYGGPDPTSGHTGPNVYGYNLSGDYENNLAERHLTSTPIDCSVLYNVQLKFWRWLGVETPTYDHAYVRVSNDGVSWTTVWSNSSEVTDYSWVQQEFDISSIADGEPTVYLRWTMGTTDTSWQYCGWNIDDVEIWAVEEGQPLIQIVSSEPEDGAIDARQPSAPDGSNPAGWQSIEVTFDGNVSGLTPADFAVSELGGDGVAPAVSAVTVLDTDTVEVSLSTLLEPVTWTTLTHIASDTSVTLGYLPADANADGTSGVIDITRLIDYLNGVLSPPWGEASTDMDRSGVFASPDITRMIDLLNGAGVYDPYLGAALP